MPRLLVLVSFSLLFGCASRQARVERTLENQAATYVYDRPRATLWLELSAFFVEQGFSVPGGQVGRMLTTDWRSDASSVRSRYRVEARDVEGGTALQFFLEEHRVRDRTLITAPPSSRTRESRGPLNSPEIEAEPPAGMELPQTAGPLAPALEEKRERRDLAMEWSFLERVRPRDADRMRAAASR